MATTTSHIKNTTFDSEPVAGVRLITSVMGEQPIVSITGSFLGGSATHENDMVPEVLTELLTEGTKKKSKEHIEEYLDALGAARTYSCGEDRISFAAKCLSKNLPDIITVLMEEMATSSCMESALKKVKERMRYELLQAEDSTRTRATDRLQNTVYPEMHPHHTPLVKKRIQLLARVSRRDVLEHHKKIFGRGSLILTIAGSCEHKKVEKLIRTICRKWPETRVEKRVADSVSSVSSQSIIIPMKGKPNADVVIGQPLALTKKDADFHAVMMGLQILGGRGGFSGRLMSIVREKMGLSYSIYALSRGFDNEREGYWFIWATLGVANVKKGIDASLFEVRRLVKSGVTEAELKKRKQMIEGAHAITLSSTGARAAALLGNAEDGRIVSFIDEYPKVIERLTLKRVNTALKKHIKPNHLVAIAAGDL